MIDEKAKYETIFTHFQLKLLRVLEHATTVPDLVRELNRPKSTIYGHLYKFQNMNLISKFSRPTTSRGRPLVFYRRTEKEL